MAVIEAPALSKRLREATKEVGPGAANALASAIGALSAAGAVGVSEVLALPDEQIGRLLKGGVRLLAKALYGTDLEVPGALISTTTAAVAADAGALDRSALNEQARIAREHLVASKQLLEPAEMWGLLGITRQALSKAVGDNRLFVLEVGGGQYYPAFFADPGVERKALGKVAKRLGKLPGWSKWQFFTTGKGSLGGATPLDALKRGQVDQVEAAAEAFAN
jgi:hypothetical protein